MNFLLETPRGKFFIDEFGNKSSVLKLLLLHGGPGFDSTYLRIHFAPLLKNHFHLFFVDQKGDGLSECLDSDLNKSLADYADDIASLCKTLNFNSASLGILGHSFGGFVAQTALAKFPDLFSYAILANTCADLSHMGNLGEILHQLNVSKEVCPLEEKIQAGLGTDADFVKMNSLYARLYYPEFDEKTARDLLMRGKFSVAPYENFLKFIVPNFDLKNLCSKIECPVLILGSQRDFITPPSAHEELKDLILHSSLKIFSEVGHFPFVAKGKEYADEIIKWTERQKLSL